MGVSQLFHVFLALHVAFGTTALLAGPAALFFAKGSKWHRRTGLLFYTSLVIASLTSLEMAVEKGFVFLFAVGLFSLYLVVSGLRSLNWRKLIRRGRKPRKVDWAILYFGIFGGLFSLGAGIYLLWQGNLAAIALLAFGGIGLGLCWADFSILGMGNRKRGFYIAAHATKMIGAVIAAYTALLVVNAEDMVPWAPGYVVWLAPTLVGSFVIAYWQRRLQKEFLNPESELLQGERAGYTPAR